LDAGWRKFDAATLLDSAKADAVVTAFKDAVKFCLDAACNSSDSSRPSEARPADASILGPDPLLLLSPDAEAENPTLGQSEEARRYGNATGLRRLRSPSLHEPLSCLPRSFATRRAQALGGATG
jgi:hypothetical protein